MKLLVGIPFPVEPLQLLTLTGGLLVSIVFIFFSYRYCYQKLKALNTKQIISPQEFRLVRSLFYLYVILELPSLLGEFLEFNRLFFAFRHMFSQPLYLVINVIPVYIGVIFFYRKYINPFHKSIEEGTTKSLSDSVSKIFNSTEFYNAISTVLPKGEKDGDYGLDYIPFMLQNLKDKRTRFEKSSFNFLITTISLSIFFVITIIVFSYILLKESSIGIYSDIKELEKRVDDFGQTLSVLKIDLSKDNYFKKSNSVNLEQLIKPHEFRLENDEFLAAYKVAKTIQDFDLDGDLSKLAKELNKVQDSLEKVGGFNASYLTMLERTTNGVNNFLKLRGSTYNQIETTQADIKNNILPKIQADLDKPSNTQNELIKRLILSIVVVTFFLAILRYFRSLYQSHYNEMLKAEHQDLVIRKFYVTLKSSEGQTEERKLVLANFLSDTHGIYPNETTNVQDLKSKAGKIENDILRDLVNGILKKF